MARKCETSGETSGKNEIPISHLLYADDVLVFTNGANRSLNSLMALLRNYERSLGQLINIDKSSFYVGNRAQSRITHINRITGMTHKEFPLRYLGVPIFAGRSRLIYFPSYSQPPAGEDEGYSSSNGQGRPTNFLPSYTSKCRCCSQASTESIIHLFTQSDVAPGCMALLW